MDWAVCGGAAIDDAHPETLVLYSRYLLTGADRQPAKYRRRGAGRRLKELAQEGEITERDSDFLPPRQTSGQRYYHQLFLLRRCSIRLSGERQSSFRWWSFCYSNLSAQTFCAYG